jgi:hypothetical protein
MRKEMIEKMELSLWKDRIEKFLETPIGEEEERDGGFIASNDGLTIYLTKEFKELIQKHNLELHFAYQMNFGTELTLMAFKNHDYVIIEVTENHIDEIKSWVHLKEFYRNIPLQKFKEKSEKHKKLASFIQKEFIDKATNRLEVITGIIKGKYT